MCLKPYDEQERIPKILFPCGHSFCKTCLRDLFENRSKDKYVPCPICRRLVERPDHVNDLATNFLFFDIPSRSKTELNCTIHTDKPITFVCTDCMCYLCNSCVEKGEHSRHTVKEVTNTKEDFDNRSSKMADILASLETYAKETEQQSERLLSDVIEHVRDEINKRSEQVIESANEWRTEMLAKVDAIMTSVSGDLKNKFASVNTSIRDVDKKHKLCTNSSKLIVLHDIQKKANEISANIKLNSHVVPAVSISGPITVRIGQLHRQGK